MGGQVEINSGLVCARAQQMNAAVSLLCEARVAEGKRTARAQRGRDGRREGRSVRDVVVPRLGRAYSGQRAPAARGGRVLARDQCRAVVDPPGAVYLELDAEVVHAGEPFLAKGVAVVHRVGDPADRVRAQLHLVFCAGALFTIQRRTAGGEEPHEEGAKGPGRPRASRP